MLIRLLILAVRYSLQFIYPIRSQSVFKWLKAGFGKGVVRLWGLTGFHFPRPPTHRGLRRPAHELTRPLPGRLQCSSLMLTKL